jgi:HPt (histidine-containing phosphotransfer) domain-containing protein
LDAALVRVGGDIDLLIEITRLFLDEYPRSLAEVRDGARRADFAVVERSAHGLKGAASNFGAVEVVGAALRIEQMGRARTLEEFPTALATLEAALAALRAELEALIAR